ncbi:MAG: phenylalanine--tRNA ligase subunit beta [Moraxellaceae bacterium]|jgi:phenylalanyl-tRNA synthetase beta chain|nr:phenylalanine--tRNA ligase subunit beta [Moraxellaceae bacterium]
MQFSEKWLREWINPALDTEALGHQLTMAGLEVDEIAPVASAFTGVLVGEVLDVAPHPDADKLRVTKVNTGTETLQIVCGAANVRPGLRVPVATIGAVLPGDFRIKPAKLRGVESFGMLCSAAELGMVDRADGLMELPADAPVGTSIRDYLQLDDSVIELGITPNRGDCLSIRGLAREAAVLNRLDVQGPTILPHKSVHADSLGVVLKAPEACPLYAGRIIRNVNVRAETPLWMAERLRRGGVRAINPVVDVTNYVLLELGQPMHAFDLAKLSGGIVVRHAEEEELLELLDGQTVKLRADTLVIADSEKALAMAGIMGGQGSAVGDDTRDIFLESAFFAPLALAGRARSYGLHTDSSHRFERGVDFAGQVEAIERATALVLEICGGEPGPVTLAVAGEHLPVRAPITLREARIDQLLGITLPAADIEDILTRLGISVTRIEGGWQAMPPSWRFDIAIEVDLIEEVARVHGYNNFPKAVPQASLRLTPQSETRPSEPRIKRLLVDMGWQEAITMSFVEPGLLARFDPGTTPLALANPISADLSVMRTTLWAGLVKAVLFNQNRQQSRVRLFETGLRFVPGSEGLVQERMLAGVAYGTVLPELWANSKKPLDFFDIKGNIESLFALLNASDRVAFKAAQHPALHPGQTAEIVTEERHLGWMGRLHPRLESDLGLAGPVYLFEISLEGLPAGALPLAGELSRFPEVRRDIALVADRKLPAAEVLAVAAQAAGAELRDCRLFDVYEGQGVVEGCRSLAIGLVWQHPERTLQEEEVQNRVDAVLNELKTRFGVTLRD